MKYLIKALAIVALCSAVLFKGSLAQKRFLGILFAESDKTHSQQQINAVESQLRLAQREFFENVGATFQIASPAVEVVKGDQNSAWYNDNPSPVAPGNTNLPRFYRLENMREEIVRKLNLDADVRLVVYPLSISNGKIAAFRNLPVGQGAYMDFDDLTCA